jgi:multicomponent Na+:H+ antiporter subunit D
MNTGIHPPEVRAINLDTDWIYRKFLPNITNVIYKNFTSLWDDAANLVKKCLGQILNFLHKVHGPETGVSSVRATGSMALWIAALLAFSLIISYV